MTMIPDSRSRTFNFTWMNPVTHPARTPAANAANSVSTGLTPASISVTVTAPPSGNVPSTDKSGKSRIL